MLTTLLIFIVVSLTPGGKNSKMSAMSKANSSSKLKQVKIMLPADLHSQCLRQAQTQGLSLAAYLRTLLYRELSPTAKNDKIKSAISTSASPDLELERVREIW